MSTGRSTYYLRTHFSWEFDSAGAGILISNYLSAGAVFHLNGSEIKRVRMPAGSVSYSTQATGGPAQPGTAELIDLPTGALVVGDNLLEVEVHPAAGAGASLVFGLSMTASDSFAPRIEDPSQPADRSVIEGEATTFTAGAVAGTGPFSYQWFKDGASIPDATNAALILDPVVPTDAGSYSVEITNPKGVKTTSRGAVLATTAVPVALVDARLPADQVVAEGTSVTLAVTATGSLVTYQWFEGDVPIEGATGPQLILPNVSLADSGKQYSVTASNRLNSLTSRKATLTVVNDKAPPAITSAAGGGRRIRVIFTEPIDPVSAQQASNYSLDGGAQVQGAELDPARADAVTLTTTLQTFGRSYRLSANGVKDLYGNAAQAVFPFQSTILIDGDFDDWSGVPVALTQEQLNPGRVEFQELSITNDADYVYVRFSFYEPVGPLAAANWDNLGQYYQVVFDTDADPATGGWNGGEVMNEVGNLARLGGAWTDGVFLGGDTALAPAEVLSSTFESRVSLRATHERDHSRAFPNSTINVFCALRNTGWTEIAITAFNPPVSYTITALPPAEVTITARRVGTKIELTWPGGGVLETCSSLSAGNWTPVTGAASGVQIDPTVGAAGFYRVRQ